MFSSLFNWLDDRTGIKKFMDMMLLEHIPGGSRWRYVWGSCLAFVFTIQLVTGVLLMMNYSASDSSAWGSVYFIQYQMDFGWLIRGLHHFGSQTMVVLLGVHMLQVVIAGAHLSPREINWWLGLALMGVVFGLSLTGYLLPWDQKGFYATQVATNIIGNVPLIGDFLKKVVIGGTEYGNHTLTKFYALHVGVLPPLLIVLLVMHVAVFRRHGITHSKNPQGMEMFWPDQVFKDLVVCMIIFGVMLYLVLYGGHGNKIDTGIDPANQSIYERWAHAGQQGYGANLDAPADPQTQGYPARPEWYFLFLFQLLKYTDITTGSLIIPNVAMGVLFILPLFGHGPLRKLVHFLSVVIVLFLLMAALGLTVLALADDAPDGVYLVTWPLLKLYTLLLMAIFFSFRRKMPGFAKAVIGLLAWVLIALFVLDKVHVEAAKPLYDLYELRVPPGDKDKAIHFQEDMEKAEHEAKLAVQAAATGLPEEGSRYVLRNNPLAQGPRLFKANCMSCHNWSQPVWEWTFEEEKKKNEAIRKGEKYEPARPVYTASDLAGFGTQEWIRGLLENPGSPKYFGLVKEPETGKQRLTGMIGWRRGVDQWKEDNKDNPEKLAEFEKDLDILSQYLAQQRLPEDARDKDLEALGAKTFKKKGTIKCASCHSVGDDEPGTGPNLTGYGSAEWIRLMVMSPANPLRYAEKNFMPGFREKDGVAGQVTELDFKQTNPDCTLMELSNLNREMILRWMTGDPRVVFGGQPISGIVIEKKK